MSALGQKRTSELALRYAQRNSSGSLAMFAAIRRATEYLAEHHCACFYRTRPICPQSLNGKMVEVLANPLGLSVDVLNDDTGDLLRSRAGGHTYAVHEAKAKNNPLTEALTRDLLFGFSDVGKSY